MWVQKELGLNPNHESEPLFKGNTRAIRTIFGRRLKSFAFGLWEFVLLPRGTVLTLRDPPTWECFVFVVFFSREGHHHQLRGVYIYIYIGSIGGVPYIYIYVLFV